VPPDKSVPIPTQSITGTKADALPPLNESVKTNQNVNLQNQLSQPVQQANVNQNYPPQTPPPTQNTPPPQNPNFNQKQKKGFFTKGKIIAVFLVFLIAGLFSGSVALAYNNYEIISPPEPIKKIIEAVVISTPLPKTPRMILEKSVLAIFELETAFVGYEFSFETTEPSFPIKNARIKIKGPIELKKCQTRSRGAIAVLHKSIF